VSRPVQLKGKVTDQSSRRPVVLVTDTMQAALRCVAKCRKKKEVGANPALLACLLPCLCPTS
jgi:hypothetical protein